MRTTTAALLVALVATLAVAASPASASFHLMKVSEVQLSRGGDATAQFVELQDSSDEPFPSSSGPYKVVVYDAAGAKVAAHDIGSALENPTDASQPFLIATATASGVTPDQALSVALPAGAGQVCFTNGPSESKVHCIAYGCVTTVVGSADRGPVPPDGQSLQRQAGGALQLAAPTPDAANSAGTTSESCPSGTPTPTPSASPSPSPTSGPSPEPGEPTTTPAPSEAKPKVKVVKLATRISRLVLRGAGLPIRLDTNAKRVVLRLRAGKRLLVSRTVRPQSGRIDLRLRPPDSTKNRRAIVANRSVRLEIVASNGSALTRVVRTVRLGK